VLRYAYVYVQSGERFPFMTQSLLLKIKDVYINTAGVKMAHVLLLHRNTAWP